MDYFTTMVTMTPATRGGTALALILPIVAWWLYRTYYCKPQSRPQLPPIANVGLWETIRENTGSNTARFYLDQYEEMDDLFRSPLPGCVIVVCNQVDARAVYKAAASHKPPGCTSRWSTWLGGPSLASMAGASVASFGDTWHHRRKGMNPAFGPKRIKRMNDVAMEKLEAWIERTLQGADCVDINICEQMVLLTIDIICKAAFDYDIGIVNGEAELMLQCIRDTVEEFTLKSMVNPFRPFVGFMLKDRQQALRSAATMQDLGKKIIANYKNNPSPTEGTLLDYIMKNDNYKNDAERIPDIIVSLVAGYDTTGVTLALALFELCKNPKQQQTLRDKL